MINLVPGANGCADPDCDQTCEAMDAQSSGNRLDISGRSVYVANETDSEV